MVKDDLVALATVLLLKLKVVHGPATLVLGQIREENVVVRGGLRLELDDLRLVLAESEDDVLVLLPQFQLLVQGQAIWVHGYAGRLMGNKVMVIIKHLLNAETGECFRTISLCCWCWWWESGARVNEVG